MIRQLIAQTAGFPLQDFFTKTRILETLSFLRESQYWDESRMADYRMIKLKRLVEHSYKNVPFYRDEFDKIKLKPADINNIEDIQKIPIVTKEIFRSRNYDFIAKGWQSRHIKIGKTGGTTGPPMIVHKDQYDRTYTWASYYRWYEWMGIKPGEKTFTLWGARNVTRDSLSDNIKQSIINYLQNSVIVNSFTITRESLPDVIDLIHRTNPVLLKGYLSSLLLLAHHIEDEKIRLTIPLKAVSSTTETLLPQSRALLERAFKVPVFDQYGCGEVSGIAYECASHKGLHVTEEHVIAEILDEDMRMAKHHGKVVITNLDNLIMPFIRYENGDLASVSDSKCTCGLNSQLLSSIDGRTCDTIILKNGARVHGVFFTDILYEKGIHADKIERFQVVQKFPGIIEFRIENSKSIDPSILNQLRKSLSLYFDQVEIACSDRLPNEPNGKFRYIKSDVTPIHGELQ